MNQTLMNWMMKTFLKFFGVLTEINKPLKSIPRFAFVGEFGYAYFGYLPYLNYLASVKNLSIRTIGTKGSSPFYYFSDDHLEIDMEPTGSWGSFRGAMKLVKYSSRKDPIYVPLSFTSRTLNIAKEIPIWQSRHLHVYHEEYLSFKELRLPVSDIGISQLSLPKGVKYFVVNIKNYQSWSNQFILIDLQYCQVGTKSYMKTNLLTTSFLNFKR